MSVVTTCCTLEKTEEKKINSDVPIEWTYKGINGPSNWSKLCPKYSKCENGKNQSPINISSSDFIKVNHFDMDYEKTELIVRNNEHMHDIIDNGHTIQANVDNASIITIKDTKYTLKQFHFHTPSEHTINGESFPMEMHMVHLSDQNSIAVISFLFKESNEENEEINKLIKHLPTKKGEQINLNGEVFDINKFDKMELSKVYHYSGSLTTPPCSEEVEWIIIEDKVFASKNQISSFYDIIGPNNRPTQSINNRKIIEDVLEKN
jgi:carbonic anhydrase